MVYKMSVIAVNRGRERHEHRSRGRSAATLVVRVPTTFKRFPTSLRKPRERARDALSP
jgi:hypothetical protein